MSSNELRCWCCISILVIRRSAYSPSKYLSQPRLIFFILLFPFSFHYSVHHFCWCYRFNRLCLLYSCPWHFGHVLIILTFIDVFIVVCHDTFVFLAVSVMFLSCLQRFCRRSLLCCHRCCLLRRCCHRLCLIHCHLWRCYRSSSRSWRCRT